MCDSRTMQEIGGYRLERQLGAGGMGTVWLAHDADGREVAFKLLHPHISKDPSARARLAREVDLLHRVRGAGVARVVDAEVDDEDAFVVTELIEGPTLSQDVEQEGPFTGRELSGLAMGLADALETIHGVGVVHRDLKPGNVMMSPVGPVIIDFGIAQIADDTRLTQTGMVTGTPGYLDPEVINGGEVTVACDWWAWAAVLAFAGTGRVPFGNGPALAVIKRMSEHAVDLEGMEPLAAAALRAALRPDSAKRLSPDAVMAVLDGRWDEADLADALADIDALDESTPSPEAPPVIPPLAETPRALSPTAVLPGSPHTIAAPLNSTPQVPHWPGPAGWWPDVAPPPPDPPPEWARPAPPRRAVVFAVGALCVALAAIVPIWSVGALAVLAVATGGWGRAALARRRSHAIRGNRPRDGARTIASIPGYLLGSAIVVALTMAFALALVWGILVVAEAQHVPLPAGPFLWAASALTALLVWWGPGSGPAREGARLAVRDLFPVRVMRIALVLVSLGVASVVVIIVVNGIEPDWNPLTGAPLEALVPWP